MARPGFTLQRRLARRRQERRDAPAGDAPRPGGREPAATDTPRPGFWHRFDAGMTRARSLVLSTAVLLVLGVIGWSVAQELIRDPVIIEPLAVPESVAKKGWTGEVLARLIRDGVREINEGAKTQRVRADYLFDREQLDLVLPGASVSIRTMVTVVRGVLGRPARRVAGEVIELDDRERQAACEGASQGASPAGLRYRLVGRLNNAARPWTACAAAVGDLPHIAARELVLATTPYIYASYQYERDPAQAKTIAEAILADRKAHADHPYALSLLGLILENKKKFVDAIDKYQEALRRDPNLVAAYVNWGNALQYLKQPEEAIGKYEEALRCDPNYAYAYNNWGLALLALQRPEEAIGKYEEALRRDPDSAAAYFNWGYALQDLQRPEEAIGKYEEALRRDPNSAATYFNWGYALQDLQRPEEAIGKYEEALRRDPNYAAAYFNWGYALQELERPEEAIGKYEEALRRDPNYADAYNNWAIALDRLGRHDEGEVKRAVYQCLSGGRKIGECSAAADVPDAGGAALSTKEKRAPPTAQ